MNLLSSPCHMWSDSVIEIDRQTEIDPDGFCVRSFVLFLLSYWDIPVVLLEIV